MINSYINRFIVLLKSCKRTEVIPSVSLQKDSPKWNDIHTGETEQSNEQMMQNECESDLFEMYLIDHSLVKSIEKSTKQTLCLSFFHLIQNIFT